MAALQRAGLVIRRVDPDDHRVQVLHPTEAGAELLRQVTVNRRQIFGERLADWPEEDLRRFADYLVRYNDASHEDPGA